MSKPSKLAVSICAVLALAAWGSGVASPPDEPEAVEAASADAGPEPMALPEFVVTPLEAEAVPENVVGAASVTLSLRDNVLWFSAASAGYNPPGGQTLLVADPPPLVIRTEGGDLDLTGFPPGNVRLTVMIDGSVFGGGYRIPADAWQAVALAVNPAGGPPSTPVFGQASWPANFEAPSVAADQRSVTWIDTESDQNVYEYSLALDGPNGRIVIDPRIKPGGSTTR